MVNLKLSALGGFRDEESQAGHWVDVLCSDTADAALAQHLQELGPHAMHGASCPRGCV